MNQLLKAAFHSKKHRFLIVFVVISMGLMTIASQMEIFVLGVLSQKGPSAFELFAPEVDGKLQPSDTLTKQNIEERWKQLDHQHSGSITKSEVKAFMNREAGQRNIIASVMRVVDRYFSVSGSLVNLALMIVFIALFKAITLFANRYSTRLVAIRVSRDLRQQYFEHIQHLPMNFYQKHDIGSLSSRVVNDAYLIAEAVNACIINYLQTPFVVATTLILCFLTSWELSLIMFFGLPLILFPIFFIAGRVRKVSRQILKKQERFLSILIDFISGIQTVKVFAIEQFSLKKYQEQNDQLAQLEQKSARYDLSSRPVVHSVAMLFLASAMLYGLYIQEMALSEVIFFCGLLYVFYEPIKKFAENNANIQRGIAATERLMEVLEQQPLAEDTVEFEEISEFNSEIKFDDVWFKYQNDWVLKGLSFEVKRGQTVAIVGATGAGKSTIVQLLPRLYDPQKGRILIDGKPLSELTRHSIRKLIGFVPQRPFIFIDTIHSNIAFGHQYASDDVIDASVKAHADEFICRLPEGYQTALAEAGKDLSGGQQQRITIARALVKKAPILIMDEATSSLDALSENHIKMAINELKGQVTQIIIAHRLSTIEDADKIIFLDEGQKIAEGTKDELLESCPGFRLMWEMLHSHQKEQVLI